MSEWKDFKLGELAEITSSKRIFYSDYVSEGVRFFRSKEIIEKSLGESSGEPLFITRERFEDIKSKFGAPVDGDLLISAVGERAGIPYVVKNLGDFYFKDGNLIWFRNIKPDLDIDFFCYWMKSSIGQMSLESIMIGSAQKALTIAGLKSLEIKIPISTYQKSISSILSSLDDKIDLLHRQNATLEKMAETLFRQWFVEEAKEDWLMGKISDYAYHLKDSILPQKKQLTYFYHYSIPAFDNNKNPIKELGQEIQSNKYQVQKYCILFSKLNPHKDKRVWLLQNEVETNAICSTEFQVVLPKRKDHLYFLYGWLSLKENYNEIASGIGGTSGSHQRIDPNTIFNFQCPLLPNNLIEDFNNQIEPLFQKQLINQIQIRTLTALRDTLLPKLMSGEVRLR
jgi:type I restriction enzyme S subunit